MTATTWRWLGYATALAWAVVMLTVRRADTITDDWQGWRQADTAAIARNLGDEEFAPLHPRIDWRGDGPGYVETELQLYPTMVAAVAAVTGDLERSGQLVSLACVVTAALLLAAALARRHGPAAGYAALLATLSMQGAVIASTTIQPDPLAFLAFTVGWLAFVADLTRPRRATWIAWVSATAIAGLVKPTTLELGLAQAALCALAHRDALRTRRVWIGWAVVLAAVIGFLLHARTLYVTYGNTFGVLSGGDSKLPALSALRAGDTWRELARFTIVWGVGVVAVPAAIYLAARRRLDATHLALALGAGALSLLALRYTASDFGTHYHLPHVVLGASLVAAAVADLRWPRAATAVVALVASLLTVRAVRFATHLPREPETTLGRALATLAPPGTRVAVRARAEGYNREWRTVNNFQDPRVFYLSRTTGWVLPNDLEGSGPLAEYARRGARYYVHVNQQPVDPDLAAWLTANAHVVATSTAGTIYDLGIRAP